MEPKRLNKFISDSGFCSRREADRLIEEERVTVNGRMPEPGMKVTPKDKVRIDDQILNVREEKTVYLVFNKPSGMSATSDMGVRDNVVRAINYPASIQPVGQLEREAEGVLFLTNDGEMARKIAKADNKYEKEYLVTVDKPITQDLIANLISGGADEAGQINKKVFVSKEGTTRFRIVLQPNTNHNIKRMCETLGYKVVHLQRLRFQNITLAKMPTGHWRTLTPAEIETLTSIALSRSVNPVGSGAVKKNYRPKEDKPFEGKDSEQRGGTKREGKSRVKSKGTAEGGAGKKFGTKSFAPGSAKGGKGFGKGSASKSATTGKPGTARGGDKPTAAARNTAPKKNTKR